MEESKRERVGGGKEVLSPSLPNPALSPFFLAHFPLRFSNYLKACYRLTTCLPSFPTFYGIHSTWASSTFGTLLLISRNRFGSTNFSTAFRLWKCHFFSFLFDYLRLLNLPKRLQAVLWFERLCTDWRFSVMETLAVILNCRWQVKRLKVPFNSVWKENIVFSAKKKNNNKNRETK